MAGKAERLVGGLQVEVAIILGHKYRLGCGFDWRSFGNRSDSRRLRRSLGSFGSFDDNSADCCADAILSSETEFRDGGEILLGGLVREGKLAGKQQDAGREGEGRNRTGSEW